MHLQAIEYLYFQVGRSLAQPTAHSGRTSVAHRPHPQAPLPKQLPLPNNIYGIQFADLPSQQKPLHGRASSFAQSMASLDHFMSSPTHDSITTDLSPKRVSPDGVSESNECSSARLQASASTVDNSGGAVSESAKRRGGSIAPPGHARWNPVHQWHQQQTSGSKHDLDSMLSAKALVPQRKAVPALTYVALPRYNVDDMLKCVSDSPTSVFHRGVDRPI